MIMAKFAYSYVDVDEATPRTVFVGAMEAEDVIDVALTVMGELSMEGTRASVFNVVEIAGW